MCRIGGIPTTIKYGFKISSMSIEILCISRGYIPNIDVTKNENLIA